MKFLIFTVLGFLIIASSPQVFAAELTIYTNQQIYATQHPLLVDGTGPEIAPLIVRIFAPNGSIAEYEQITTNSDGNVVALQKGGSDGFTQEELIKCSEMSIKVGSKIREIIKQSSSGED